MLKKLLLPFAAMAALAACTSSDEPSRVLPSLDSTETRIIGSTASTDDQDATVMLFHLNQAGNGGNICTATMIAPKLALTARHCVAETDGDASCSSDGTPLSNAQIGNDLDPGTLYFFAGKARPEHTNLAQTNVDPTMWKPSGRGAQIVDDKSGTLCNHDLALVVLEAPIPNVPIATVRLLADPKIGELTTVVGWGIATSELEPSVRQQRRDVPVKLLGPNDGYPVLTKNEFSLGESICDGDSGGPIISQRTGAVIGVVSRGTNGSDPDPQHPGATCIDADNTMTKLAPFKAQFDIAFAAAGAQAKVEPKEEDPSTCSVSAPGARTGAGGIGAIGVILGLLAMIRRRR